MKNRFRSLFLNNIGLKLIGFFLAVVLWLVLSNTQDPVITSSVTVPITYNESGLESQNLVAISRPTSITIPVMIRRSRLRYLSADDFTVTADLNEVIGEIKEAPEASKILIEITKATSANYIQSWEYPQSQNYVKVVLDTVKTATYLVQINVTKELPEGYQIGNLSSSPSRVAVTGPTSSFSNLAAVKANVDLSELSELNTSVTAALALYDGNNRQLTASGLTLSQDTVEVTVGLNQTKEISISIAAYSGKPADGYVVSKVDYSPKLLMISGSQNALANISTVSIPSSELNIEGADVTKTFSIDILSYLPDDVSLTEEQSSEVTVTIELEQLQTQTFSVPASGFSFANISDEYDYALISSNVSLTLSALKADLESFDPSSLQGVIDVDGLLPGEYVSIPVSFALDSAYVLQDEPTVDVLITQKEIETTAVEVPSSEEYGQESEMRDDSDTDESVSDEMETFK